MRSLTGNGKGVFVSELLPTGDVLCYGSFFPRWSEDLLAEEE